MAYWPAGLLAYWPTGLLAYWSIGLLTYGPDLLVYWLIGLPAYWHDLLAIPDQATPGHAMPQQACWRNTGMTWVPLHEGGIPFTGYLVDITSKNTQTCRHADMLICRHADWHMCRHVTQATYQMLA